MELSEKMKKKEKKKAKFWSILYFKLLYRPFNIESVPNEFYWVYNLLLKYCLFTKFNKVSDKPLHISYFLGVSVSFTHAGNFIWHGGLKNNKIW
jgi:hypothetical protein